jgi:hypothetical protein
MRAVNLAVPQLVSALCDLAVYEIDEIAQIEKIVALLAGLVPKLPILGTD